MKILIYIICCMLFIGCTSKQPQIYEHTLEYGNFFKNYPLDKKSKSVKIKSISSYSLYSTNKMWYKKNSEFSSFAYNKWVMSPVQMVNKVIQNALMKNFEFVLNSSSLSDTDNIIEVEIIDYYQDFANNNTSHVVVLIKANLIDSKHKVIASKLFSYNEKCDELNPKSGVKYLSLVNDKLSTDIELWVREKL